MIAVQGPRAIELVQPLGRAVDRCLKYYHGRRNAHRGPRRHRQPHRLHGRRRLRADSGRPCRRGRLAIACRRRSDARRTGRARHAAARSRHAALWPRTERIDRSVPGRTGLRRRISTGRSFPGSEALARLAEQTDRPRRIGLTLTGKRVPREGFAYSRGAAKSWVRSPAARSRRRSNRPIAMGYVAAAVRYARHGTGHRYSRPRRAGASRASPSIAATRKEAAREA